MDRLLSILVQICLEAIASALTHFLYRLPFGPDVFSFISTLIRMFAMVIIITPLTFKWISVRQSYLNRKRSEALEKAWTQFTRAARGLSFEANLSLSHCTEPTWVEVFDGVAQTATACEELGRMRVLETDQAVSFSIMSMRRSIIKMRNSYRTNTELLVAIHSQQDPIGWGMGLCRGTDPFDHVTRCHLALEGLVTAVEVVASKFRR
ncbi:hypothetical protein IWX49DRAFT_624677 [Phyllosticta citricarpa]|uniref:ATP synthase protein MI25 n=1 Tax=Phyllosticta paracitricarpa TaxID=2016321 RepID=A0ABR1N9Q6_9PEZI